MQPHVSELAPRTYLRRRETRVIKCSRSSGYEWLQRGAGELYTPSSDTPPHRRLGGLLRCKQECIFTLCFITLHPSFPFSANRSSHICTPRARALLLSGIKYIEQHCVMNDNSMSELSICVFAAGNTIAKTHFTTLQNSIMTWKWGNGNVSNLLTWKLINKYRHTIF
jgi:hypothetical protein